MERTFNKVGKNLTNVFLSLLSTEQWGATLAGKPVIKVGKIENDRQPIFSFTFIKLKFTKHISEEIYLRI